MGSWCIRGKSPPSCNINGYLALKKCSTVHLSLSSVRSLWNFRSPGGFTTLGSSVWVVPDIPVLSLGGNNCVTAAVSFAFCFVCVEGGQSFQNYVWCLLAVTSGRCFAVTLLQILAKANKPQLVFGSGDLIKLLWQLFALILRLLGLLLV